MSNKLFLIAFSSIHLMPGQGTVEDLNEGLTFFNAFAKDVGEVFKPGTEPTVYQSIKQALDTYHDILHPMKSSVWHDEDEGVDYTVNGYHGLMNRLYVTGYRMPLDPATIGWAQTILTENESVGTLTLLEYENVAGLPFNVANARIIAQTSVRTKVDAETIIYQ